MHSYVEAHSRGEESEEEVGWLAQAGEMAGERPELLVVWAAGRQARLGGGLRKCVCTGQQMA